MVFDQPIWLLFALPLGVLLWVWRLPTRFLQALRTAILLLLLLAMAGLGIRLPSRAGVVVIVADQSDSMPVGHKAQQQEIIDIIQQAKGSDEQMGVVSFGRTTVIEHPSQIGRFSGFVNTPPGDASNLEQAMGMVLSMIPEGATGRLLLLSDGRWTGLDPIRNVGKAAARGIRVDYRLLQRPSARDVAIARIDAPEVVTPGENFMITTWVYSPIPTELSFEFRRGAVRLASGQRTVSSGLNRFTFRDQAHAPAVHQYVLQIGLAEGDPVPENNRARLLVGVQGPRAILHLTDTQDSGLAQMLKAGGLELHTQSGERHDWSLADLSNYSALLLENVPADRIGARGMERIASWVKQSGAGLVMTGGQRSYAPGGYFRSPLEPILPVSMELRREHRKLALAIVVAMDRSGSMMATVGGGRTKMDLANVAAVQVLDMLSEMDEFGVVAVDSSPHVIADLAPVDGAGAVRNKVLSINSQGGGIFVYEALSKASQMLLSAKAGTRHIILLADANDSEQPGKYVELLARCREANISVSVVGLGSESDVDAELLKDIALRGNGRVFFTQDAAELPRLFAQDTFTVARNTFINEQTPVRSTGGMAALTGASFDFPQPIGGYNLCYLRPEANLAARTVDEYEAPVVAAWQAGMGRVVCYTAEADGKHTGPIAQWDQRGDFFTSLVRWAAGSNRELPGNMLVTQDVSRGIYSLQLHLDPDRVDNTSLLRERPKVTTLRGRPGDLPRSDTSPMDWTSADTLGVDIPLQSDETVVSTIEVPGIGQVSLSPICLPYSPEFEPGDRGQGASELARYARLTGGQERLHVANIWDDLPRQIRRVNLSPWLVFAAMALLLLEVLERRTSLLSRHRAPTIAQTIRARLPKRRSRAQPQPSTNDVPEAASETPPEPVPVETIEVGPDVPTDRPRMEDALSRARARTRGRTRRTK